MLWRHPLYYLHRPHHGRSNAKEICLRVFMPDVRVRFYQGCLLWSWCSCVCSPSLVALTMFFNHPLITWFQPLAFNQLQSCFFIFLAVYCTIDNRRVRPIAVENLAKILFPYSPSHGFVIRISQSNWLLWMIGLFIAAYNNKTIMNSLVLFQQDFLLQLIRQKDLSQEPVLKLFKKDLLSARTLIISAWASKMAHELYHNKLCCGAVCAEYWSTSDSQSKISADETPICHLHMHLHASRFVASGSSLMSLFYYSFLFPLPTYVYHHWQMHLYVIGQTLNPAWPPVVIEVLLQCICRFWIKIVYYYSAVLILYNSDIAE